MSEEIVSYVAPNNALDISPVNKINNVDEDFYTSFDVSDDKGMRELYKALTDGGDPLKSIVNTEIDIRDVIIQNADLVSEVTGEVNTVPRTVIITKDGKMYRATSWGVFNSIRKIKMVFGTLHFEQEMRVKVKEVKVKNGFSINLVL